MTELVGARPTRRGWRPARDDDGAAMVEFAFVALLFLVFLFAIINLGALLSFKQNLTQAASEGARASVGIIDPDHAVEPDERELAAQAATEAAMTEFDQQCGSGGVTCAYKVHDCALDTDDFATLTRDTTASDACMTVRVEFDNTGSNRFLPAFPLIAALEPDSMSSQTTVRLVPVDNIP